MADDLYDADEPGAAGAAVAARDDVNEAEWLHRMRHSAAHVLAQVVLQMFPEGKIAIGPPIDTGFYYDFDLPRTLTPEDLSEIQKRMRKEMRRNHRFVWEEIPVDEARERFRDQPLKQELIDQFSTDSDQLGICTHAEFTDLCEGGHVESTKQIGPFRLTNVAGAYWRGDENRPQLQRVYGALFATREELDDHFARIEEAQRRDHRRLGRDLELFTFSEDIGAGIPLLLPDGAVVRREMERFIRELQEANGQRGPGERPRRLLPQADELPFAHDALQQLAALLPRVAPALRRVHHPLSLREVRAALRPDPSPLADPGRLPHLHRARTDLRRGRQGARTGADPLPHLRHAQLPL